MISLPSQVMSLRPYRNYKVLKLHATSDLNANEFETIQKLQGSQANWEYIHRAGEFETIQKLQGSQASNITLKLSPNHYMLAMLYSL